MIQSIILIIWRVHISPRGFTCCMHNALIRLTEGYTQIKRTVHDNLLISLQKKKFFVEQNVKEK
jgi:hypothetical protein